MSVRILLAGTGCACAVSLEDFTARILQLDAEWSQEARNRDVDGVVS